MNSAGTYEVDIEVRKVGQAIPGLRVFCDGWKREARQDVGVGVLISVLYRKKWTHPGSQRMEPSMLIPHHTKSVVLSGLESFIPEGRM